MEKRKDCRGCTVRYSGCHAACETYKANRKELDIQNARRAKTRRENDAASSMQYYGLEKSRKRRRA